MKDFKEKPGEYPFTRGIHPDGYSKGHLWTMRQFAGAGSARWTNRRFLDLLKWGQTGLSLAFDMPTLLGYDSDNPRARHHVGIGGTAVDTLHDMEVIFEGINLSDERISTSMTINGPATVLLAMYFALAQKKGARLSRLRGTVQADPFKEYMAQNEYIFPPRDFLRLFVDMVEFCAKNAPRWNPVSISGYHIREAGADAALELALTIANGLAYVEACVNRGLDVDLFAPRFSFFFDFHNDFFEEIAKIRAARYLWATEMRKRFQPKSERSLLMRTHIQTSGITLTAEQPYNNLIRVAIQALGAVLSGTQSLHTNSFDEQLNLPSDEAVKLALRTQQIIANETGVTKVVDPLGGSHHVESLTDALAQKALAVIKEIDGMGGALAAVERGWAKREIRKKAREQKEAIERGDILIIGQNIFNDEAPDEPLFEINPDNEREQKAVLSAVKRRRDERAVKKTLAEVRRAARARRNTMPFIADAVEHYATEQEIVDVFRSVFGTYKTDIHV